MLDDSFLLDLSFHRVPQRSREGRLNSSDLNPRSTDTSKTKRLGLKDEKIKELKRERERKSDGLTRRKKKTCSPLPRLLSSLFFFVFFLLSLPFCLPFLAVVAEC